MSHETMKLLVNYVAPLLIILFLVWKILLPIVNLIADIIKVFLQILHEMLSKLLEWIRRKPDPML